MNGTRTARPEETHAHLAEGNARQPRKRVTADVLLRDRQDRVLLVDPSYKEHWDLPGGIAEANEPPRLAAAREVREELGVRPPVGRPLLVDWVRPRGPWDDHLLFVFDGGRLPCEHIAALRITDPEITRFRFATTAQARALLRPDMYRRLRRAQHALRTGTTSYAE